MVKDRKDDLRYLLNCTGASSFAYLLGISLADSLLLLIPVSMLLITGILLQIKVIYFSGAISLLVVICFSFTYINLINCHGFLFKDPQTAYKYLMVPVFIQFILILIIQFGLQDKTTNQLDFKPDKGPLSYIFPFTTFYESIITVMPLLDIDNNTLQIYDKKSFNVKLQDVHYFLITMLL